MRFSICLLPALAASAFAHMEMRQPYPFRSKFNPANGPGDIDYSNTSPLAANGANFPCKGYHQGPSTGSTATYNAGGTYTLNLAGSATHGGGSCQISLSYNNGATWKVIKSIMGGCPLTSSYSFQIPSNAPSGNVLLAWSWFNLIGNREMYMNCAPVTIVGGNGDISYLPNMFVANVGNGCRTTERKETVFVNPGSNVVYGGNVSPANPAYPVC
ncbi:DNA-directed RNA polymerase [Blastomyces dermatitidis ER-3]|uniref:DNA-directed RNA polymerase n=1 Tax=Ajellomyces dermatitidis (strain ER-3 / ATCC MYA-2586) TaxID=559297 RepID=A0ABP2ENZ6_AJEDR|nr:DNA-directed RNA polymerase [Blastomyces dermatitidis ER-3]EEQ83434.1 DNA-directed RNA polymerase [Blastomyces dermatitidis ER-3]EQL35978.1 DNA-directed RNA polymerase [Blastomyces dermatitidis ATCC 26199]